MTEDDTFRTLGRIPYSEVMELYKLWREKDPDWYSIIHHDSKGALQRFLKNSDIFLQSHGWSLDEIDAKFKELEKVRYG